MTSSFREISEQKNRSEFPNSVALYLNTFSLIPLTIKIKCHRRQIFPVGKHNEFRMWYIHVECKLMDFNRLRLTVSLKSVEKSFESSRFDSE